MNSQARNIRIGVLLSLLVLCHWASAQHEIAWQLTGSPERPLDPFGPPLISDGFALVGIGGGVGVYDLETGRHRRDIVLPGKAGDRRTFAASDGRLMVTDTVWGPNEIRGSSRTYVFELASGEEVSQLQLPTPSLRVGLGSSVAMHGEFGALSSLSCLDTCFDEENFRVRGVIDIFDVTTGEHLVEIVSPDNSVFGQGLAIGDGVVAISSRSRSLETPGSVSIYSLTDGRLLNTIRADATGPLGHGFGFDLDIDENQLIIGDNPDLLGHGMLGDGRGSVSVYDLTTYQQTAKFSAADLHMEGTPGFGTSVAIDDGRVFVGAPQAGQNIKVVPPAERGALDSGACAETFMTGGPCFEKLQPALSEGEATGQVQIIDVETGGYVTRSGWRGGHAVAMSDGFALVQSRSDHQSEIYAISLAGIVPRSAPADAPLTGVGDVNNDGSVEFSDFLILSSNFGQPLFGFQNGDLNEDNIVDFLDFLILSKHYGYEDSDLLNDVSIVAVPEPLFSLGLLLWLPFLVRRLRRGEKS